MSATSVSGPTLVSLSPRFLGGLTDALFVTAGAALIAIAAQASISLPFTPVPVTGQTFAVLLVGASLGVVRGSSAAAVYVLAGVAGLPVYAHGAEGWRVLSSASGGYLLGFIAAAALTGWFAQRRWDRRFSSAIGAMLTGNVVIYLIGVSWLAVVLHTSLERSLELGLYPFVPGDVLKMYVAAAVLPSAWRVVRRPRSHPSRPRGRSTSNFGRKR